MVGIGGYRDFIKIRLNIGTNSSLKSSRSVFLSGLTLTSRSDQNTDLTPGSKESKPKFRLLNLGLRYLKTNSMLKSFK